MINEEIYLFNITENEGFARYDEQIHHEVTRKHEGCKNHEIIRKYSITLYGKCGNNHFIKCPNNATLVAPLNITIIISFMRLY